MAEREDEGDPGPRGVLARLRADPRRLLALLGAAMAVPLALLLAFAPRPEEPPAPPVVYPPLPDLADIDDVQVKKQTFLEYLLPMVQAHNERVRGIRAFLFAVREDLAANRTLDADRTERLVQLARRYRVELGESGAIDLGTLDLLLRRADVLPPSLVLAQAATESAWGTSRFARRANNLFGEWCFTEGCGIVPSRRLEGARHEVEQFDSVYASLDSYFRNLNSHPAYGGVRERRAAARAEGRPIRGADLAAGLTRYSERGADYVEEVRAIMRVNDLDAYDIVPATQTALAGP